MAILIEFNEKHIGSLIDFYVEKQKDLRIQITSLESDLKEISDTIIKLKQTEKELESDNTFNSSDTDKYSADWTWVKKISYAFTIAQKPLSTKEIVDILEQLEPQIIIERRSAIASVSAILSSKSGTYDQKKSFVRVPSEWGDSKFDIRREQNSPLQPVDDLPF